MDQVVLLERLEKVAAIMKKGGLHRLTRLGRNVAESVLGSDLTVQFDDLHMSAPIGLRGFLYRVRRASMEAYMSKLFLDAIRPNSVVLDVGACVGYYTLLAAKRGAKVFAFEPDANVFKFLVENIRQNNLSERVVAVSSAVSSTTGTTTFFINDDPVLNSFFANSGAVKHIVEVNTTTIDEFIDKRTTLDVVKIDIEGAELGALAGMQQTLARSKELTMFVESNPDCLRSAGHSPQELITRIEGLGFHVMRIDERNARLCPILDTETLTRTVNLYCTRQRVTHSFLNVI